MKDNDENPGHEESETDRRARLAIEAAGRLPPIKPANTGGGGSGGGTSQPNSEPKWADERFELPHEYLDEWTSDAIHTVFQEAVLKYQPESLFLNSEGMIVRVNERQESAVAPVECFIGLVDKDMVTNVLRNAVVTFNLIWQPDDNGGGTWVKKYRRISETDGAKFMKWEGIKLPLLFSVLDHLSIDPKGKWLSKEGYNADHSVMVKINHPLPELKDKYSQQEAADALKWLKANVYDEFPFADDVAKDVAVVACLTALTKRLFGYRSPGFLVTAPAAGSGKSELVYTISRIVSGSPVGVNTPPKKGATDEEANRKRYYAAARSGAAIFLIDNLNRGSILDDDMINAVITAEKLDDRQMYTQNVISVRITFITFFTGNNVELGNDSARRVVPIRFRQTQADMTRRAFNKHLPDYIAANRADIVHRHMLILKAYIDAGMPGRRSGTQSGERACQTLFPQWEEYILEAVRWAGGKDIAVLMQETVASDPLEEAREVLLEEMANLYIHEPESQREQAAKAVGEPYTPELSGAFSAKTLSDDINAGDPLSSSHDVRRNGLFNAWKSVYGNSAPSIQFIAPRLRSLKDEIHGDYRIAEVRGQPQCEGKPGRLLNYVIERV